MKTSVLSSFSSSIKSPCPITSNIPSSSVELTFKKLSRLVVSVAKTREKSFNRYQISPLRILFAISSGSIAPCMKKSYKYAFSGLSEKVLMYGITAFSRNIPERVEEHRSSMEVKLSECPERATKWDRACVAGSVLRAAAIVEECQPPPMVTLVSGRVWSSPLTCCSAKLCTYVVNVSNVS